MNKYRATYEWWVDEHKLNKGSKDFEAPNPISALNQFHQWMQWGRELVKGSMDVIRPNLCHNDYKLLSLAHVYLSEPENKVRRLIESQVDLPTTPNPNLNRIVNAYDETTVEFGFVKDIDAERIGAFEQAHKP